jgi:ribose transport system ATP-binding protein
MRGVSKSFGPTRALRDARLEVGRGEVRALLGENGAGKSTLMKILSGALRPDAGEMSLDGRAYAPASPLDGRRRGVSMIYQELNLVPHLTVEENIMLGREESSLGFIRRAEMRRRVREALELAGHPEIPPETPVRRLRLGLRQVVEIARALTEKARVLVMDEPTSSLSREDTEGLFDIIRNLSAEGVSIVYISHFLEEVRSVARSLTVLRDGEVAFSGPMGRLGTSDLIKLMVGREVKEAFPRTIRRPGEAVLTGRGIQGRGMQAPVDFVLRRGEILGLAGLVGSGRTETLRALFGLDRLARGRLETGGAVRLRGGPRMMILRGLGYLSEDRQGEGLALGRSVVDNLTLSRLEPYARLGVLGLRARRRAAAEWMARMNIRARSAEQPVEALSGGNQQKVALARLLHQGADILLLDEPTRGIDVVSKAQIYEWMDRLAAGGKAVVFVSSYVQELIGVCDRVAVFHRGRVAAERPASEWDERGLMACAAMGRT